MCHPIQGRYISDKVSMPFSDHTCISYSSWLENVEKECTKWLRRTNPILSGKNGPLEKEMFSSESSFFHNPPILSDKCGERDFHSLPIAYLLCWWWTAPDTWMLIAMHMLILDLLPNHSFSPTNLSNVTSCIKADALGHLSTRWITFPRWKI